ncbi:tRNA glutamyl-Q(34) synthetase GluQRS [Aeromicrobium sp. A1-2]|uniref:tRNA glutamyl-Q(34) synthetase GluQRS n=1 Tax=Aeromicrobium sp. A1-2 TaxID=2107713 RepID=UPI000E4F4465|nr:tRNA glutamyl-Q(34) synthetase GluQRS [Aeromicrobium sp. A1-2]AXT86112.1 tRNA glutamyl-Q(34) synthetase GluQRS [Aeromicrobium sp. A1-2]
MSAGRFAPSPSGDLHIGNLRTALLAWLWARHSGRDFLLRIEDLDRVRPGAERRQLADLRAIGLDWDDEPLRQSERHASYAEALDQLERAGRTYQCFCSRREIRQAPTAPHAPPGAYPGTCRELTNAQSADLRRRRPAALRLRADVSKFVVQDEIHGSYEGAVDDFVLRRGDGVPAYNLAVVVDDAEQGVDQVVRGDDLLASSPRQAYLGGLLGAAIPTYVHVPLALNVTGRRLAKRDGAVTLEQLRQHGVDAFDLLARSWGLSGTSPVELLRSFDPTTQPTGPWVFRPPTSAGR